MNGALVHDPEEQKALALIRRLRTADASYRSIAEALTTAGYKPRGKRHNGRAPSGRWHPETIRKIVERDAA